MTYTYFENLPAMLPTLPEDSIISRVIYKDDTCNVTLFAFAAGQELTEHTATSAAILQVLDGSFSLTLGSDTVAFETGAWVHMPPQLVHGLVAHRPSQLLLTLLKNAKA